MRMLNPPHPGEFIRAEIIAPRSLSVTAAAEALQVSRPALSSLLNGKADLSGEMALRLEKAFGVKMDTLMRMQASYDIARTRKREKEIQELAEVRKKIYIFYQPKDGNLYDFVALAEDGECLSTWRSESDEDGQTDARSTKNLESYNTKYPEGWGLVWRGGPIGPDTMPVPTQTSPRSLAFIEGRLYHEFLRALTA